MVKLNEMQIMFVFGGQTIDAIIKQWQVFEKYEMAKKIYIMFVELQEVLYHIPREVIWRTTRIKGMMERELLVITEMYQN